MKYIKAYEGTIGTPYGMADELRHVVNCGELGKLKRLLQVGYGAALKPDLNVTGEYGYTNRANGVYMGEVEISEKDIEKWKFKNDIKKYNL